MNSAMVVRCLTVTFDTARFPCSKGREGRGTVGAAATSSLDSVFNT